MTTRSRKWIAFILSILPAALAGCSSDGQEPKEAGGGDEISSQNDSASSPESSTDSATSDARGDASADRTADGPPEAHTDATVSDGSDDGMNWVEASSDTPANAGDGGNPCPADGGVADFLPDELRCTGLYSNWAAKTIAPDVTQYTPGVQLWSDGAQKTRWLWLPPGTKIDTSDMNNWSFPTGTKVWKQFVVGGKTIETRLLWKQAGNPSYMPWTYAVYRWSNDETSTFSMIMGEQNVNGTTYEVPSTWVCTQCHAGQPDNVLGLDLIGTGISTAQGITLAFLVSKGLLSNPPPVTQVVVPDDAKNKAAPALAWLHMNCGVTCHNTNSTTMARYTQLYLKLLAEQLYPPDGGVAHLVNLDAYTTSVNVLSHLQPNGQPYLRIAPGDAGASLLALMTNTRGPDAGIFLPMPPIVSHIPDPADMQLVTDWISALPQ